MFRLMNAVRDVLFILDTGNSVNEGAALLICQPLLIFIVCLSCDFKCPHPTMELPAVYLLPIPPHLDITSPRKQSCFLHMLAHCVLRRVQVMSAEGCLSECLMLPFAPVIWCQQTLGQSHPLRCCCVLVILNPAERNDTAGVFKMPPDLCPDGSR